MFTMDVKQQHNNHKVRTVILFCVPVLMIFMVNLFFSTVQFTAPSLNAGATMTDFLVDHIQDNMLAIVKQNNPMLLVEYGIAALNFLNEQSRIATDDSELSTRRAIRALIMTSLEDLPRETTCAIQQMAGVAQFVTVSIIFLWLNPIAPIVQ